MTACCTDTASMVHQRLAHADEAALRTAGGARWARTRTRSRTSWCAPAFHRPPTSLPSTTSCWGPLFSSGYAALLSVLGDPQCASQRRHECGVAAQGPSERRRSVNYEVQAAPVIGADVGCCCVRQPLLGDHLPIRTHGLPSHTHPRTLYDLRPASYQTSACASEGVVAKSVHFSSQRLAHKGSGRRRRRRTAKSIAWGGSAQAGPLGMAVNQAPACKGAGGRGQGRQQRAFAKARRFEYAMHSTAIHVASRPGPGRSGEVDGLPLRLLPRRGTRANLPPGEARVPQLHSSSSGAHPPSVASKRVQASAKAGERLWSSGNASAHAAQYAAGAVRIAERKPRPPRAAGKVATCCACATSASAMPPKQSSNVSHIAASRAWA